MDVFIVLGRHLEDSLLKTSRTAFGFWTLAQVLKQISRAGKE